MTEIIDRKPDGKKRGMTTPQIILSLVLLLVGGGILYLITHSPNARNDMVVVNVAGIDIVPGETKISDFLDAGFELSQNQAGDILDETQNMEKDTYVPLILLTKDRNYYGTVSLGNDTGKDAPLSKAIILSVSVYGSDTNAENAAADNIAMKDLTEEALTDKYGPAQTREEAEYIGGTNLEWENKGYYFSANIGDDGKVHMLHSSYGHY